jgi:hypothetical protein
MDARDETHNTRLSAAAGNLELAALAHVGLGVRALGSWGRAEVLLGLATAAASYKPSR